MSAKAAMSHEDDAYTKQLRSEIIAHLLSVGGKISDDYIQKLPCAGCGKKEAWTKVVDPTVIICNRKNNCGTNNHIKSIAPHLFANWAERYPSSKADPMASARAYLQSRGLDHDKFEYEQGTWKEDGCNVTTVAFSCSWTKRRWHRFLDIPKGINGKTRWDSGNGDAYRGQAWTHQQVEPEVELWMVEGIFEALSLQQGVGIQAAATFSSSHIPTTFYERLERNQKIVIALNSDPAGQGGTLKNIQALKDLGFSNVTGAQPPVGKDWNDLL